MDATDSGAVADPLRAELEELATLPAEQLSPIVEGVLQFLMDAKSAEFQEKILGFAAMLKVSPAALKKSLRALIVFLQRGLKESWSVVTLGERCGLVGLPSAVVCGCWATHEQQISRSLLSRISTTTQLIDMDWSFGVTTATDDCDQVGKTFLQVKFKIGGSAGSQDVFMELSLEQFYQFLAQMEKAKAYLDYIKEDI